MRRVKLFKYFFEEDVLYISLSKEKSPIGDEDFQNSVVLYRKNKKVIGIEIQHFTKFKESNIIIAQNDVMDLSEPFKRIRMVISLRDIINSDPEQFEETMKEWGFKKMNRPVKILSQTDVSYVGKEMSNFSFA